MASSICGLLFSNFIHIDLHCHKVLKQSVNDFFSGDVIPGHYGLLANMAKLCFFAKFQNLTMKLFAAVLSLSLFCSYSVSLVSMQMSEAC